MGKIAIAYDGGNVNQHFGHTKQFKIYQVEGNLIKSSEIISVEGTRHGDCVGTLLDNDVDTVICDMIGSGVRNILWDNGIDTYADVRGNADECMLQFLKGELLYIRGFNYPYEGKDGKCGIPDKV